MKPILLATDGSPSAEAATQEAIELAQAFDAPLVVVSVAHLAVPPYGGYYGYPEIIADIHAGEVERVGKLLAEVKDRALTAGLTCETVALDGPAAAEICRVAASTQPTTDRGRRSRLGPHRADPARKRLDRRAARGHVPGPRRARRGARSRPTISSAAKAGHRHLR